MILPLLLLEWMESLFKCYYLLLKSHWKFLITTGLPRLVVLVRSESLGPETECVVMLVHSMAFSFWRVAIDTMHFRRIPPN